MLKSTNSLIATINKMTPASSLVNKPTIVEVIKEKLMNKTKKDEVVEDLIYKDKKLKFSSFGFHYWNADKNPTNADSFWPPLADRYKMKKIKSTPDMTMTTKRQDILEWNKHN